MIIYIYDVICIAAGQTVYAMLCQIFNHITIFLKQIFFLNSSQFKVSVLLKYKLTTCCLNTARSTVLAHSVY